MNRPASLDALLAAVRRRLRVAWVLATAQVVGPAVAAAALVLVLVGRARPWGWPEPAAAGVAAATALALVATAIVMRVPDLVAARAADRGLHTGDAFATALELDARPTALDGHVRTRAADLSVGQKASDAVPLRVRPRRVLLVGVLGAAAVVLALVANHQDDVRRREAAEHAALRAESRQIAKAASDQKAASTSPGQDTVARQLAELARKLAGAGSIQQGRDAIQEAARNLANRLSPDLLAQKAAVRGLDRTLAATPLPGGGSGDAASQLQSLASAVNRLDPAAQAALADRLSALAATQSAGDPTAAHALDQAASALRAGTTAAAAAGLNAAADAQSAASTSVSDQEAAMNALADLAASDARLGEASTAAQGQAGGQSNADQSPSGQSPSGQGQAGQGQQGQGGQGQGQGQGQGGQGQGGQGQGGQGQGGQGQGQGQGGQGSQTGSGASGQVGGTNAATGSGQGGAGTPNGTGNNASVGLQEATVFSPPAAGNDGEQVNATGQLHDGPTSETGQRGNGPSGASPAQVPLSRVLPQYQAAATQALSRLGLPPSQRALVQAYFSSLAGR